MSKIPRKLNLGAGPLWPIKEGWTVVDHGKGLFKVNQAWDIPFPKNSFDTVFCSHMFEHISHFKIEEVLCEVNRVMTQGGIFRILTPDLKKIAAAYVNGDEAAMDLYIKEDGGGNVRKDLGLGQSLLQFILSAGYDNFLCDSQLSGPLVGYAHVASYDFQMLSGLLAHHGFGEIRQCHIDDSRIPDHKELRIVPYDVDKEHSLIIECTKVKDVRFDPKTCIFHRGFYDTGKMENLPQHMFTRLAMKVTSGLDNLSYRLFRSAYKKLQSPSDLHS